jgi:carbonyl reductase 1
MPDPKVALVTGGNRGLGLALVRGLCRALPAGSDVWLGARDEARGRDAIAALEAEGLAPRLCMVDVDDDASVAGTAARIGAIDIVISNAARPITPERPQREQVAAFVNTNNAGTHRMIRRFGPQVADGGRFLVVASGLGVLRYLDPPAATRFETAARLEDLEAVLRDFVADTLAERPGWGPWINVPSKVGQVAAMRIYAREQQAEAARRGILIDAVCPGLVDTEASRPWFRDMSRARSPDAAAVDVVTLATLPPGTAEPYGELVRYGKVLPFAERPPGKTAAELLAEIGINA